MSRAREFADLAGSADAGGLTGRNLVINGAMQVAQRGTSATVGPNGTGEGYTTVDRWQNPLNGSVVSTFSQSTDAPPGFSNSAKIEITTADSSLGSTEFWFFRTALEGQDVQSIAKGTSSAKALTLSFWVKSNKTGTYTVEVKDSDNDRVSSLAYTVSSSNVWEHKTLTYNADTTGEFDNDNAASLRIQFWLVAGSQYQGGTFSNGTFESETDANRVHSSQVNLGDTVGNEWYITGIQLEVGSQATPFEHRSFHDEVMRCQRYYAQSGGPAEPFASGNYSYQGDMASHGSSNGWHGAVFLPTTMRDNPTMTAGTTQAYNGSSWASWNTVSLGTRRPNSFHYDLAGTVSTSNGQSLLFRSDWKADSEL